MGRRCGPLPAIILAVVVGVAGLASPAGTAADPDVFPGARPDAAESAALATERGAPRVFRSDHPFDIVVNYYRFKRKQGVHVVTEPLAAPYERIADVMARGGSPALVSSRFVQQFHQKTFGTARIEPRRAAQAWREFAGRVAGPTQRIGEGDRVTIYRPYISRSDFAVVEETVIILHNSGGSR